MAIFPPGVQQSRPGRSHTASWLFSASPSRAPYSLSPPLFLARPRVCACVSWLVLFSLGSFLVLATILIMVAVVSIPGGGSPSATNPAYDCLALSTKLDQIVVSLAQQEWRAEVRVQVSGSPAFANHTSTLYNHVNGIYDADESNAVAFLESHAQGTTFPCFMEGGGKGYVVYVRLVVVESPASAYASAYAAGALPSLYFESSLILTSNLCLLRPLPLPWACLRLGTPPPRPTADSYGGLLRRTPAAASGQVLPRQIARDSLLTLVALGLGAFFFLALFFYNLLLPTALWRKPDLPSFYSWLARQHRCHECGRHVIAPWKDGDRAPRTRWECTEHGCETFFCSRCGADHAHPHTVVEVSCSACPQSFLKRSR